MKYAPLRTRTGCQYPALPKHGLHLWNFDFSRVSIALRFRPHLPEAGLLLPVERLRDEEVVRPAVELGKVVVVVQHVHLQGGLRAEPGGGGAAVDGADDHGVPVQGLAVEGDL